MQTQFFLLIFILHICCLYLLMNFQTIYGFFEVWPRDKRERKNSLPFCKQDKKPDKPARKGAHKNITHSPQSLV